MTVDGHPHGPRGSDEDRADPGGGPPDEPVDSPRRDADATDRSTSAGGQDDPDVDELRARLRQKDATLQNVIDRYEVVLDERDSGDDRGGSRRSDGFVDAARRRLDDVMTDIEMALRSRRR